uniref:Uncharacterized protein n=1 Tax=Globisporangium ultimum (strain ATCC 200006 / CBS 805.95 / DAOM BR144) TaxID=431595 RepID=K3WRR7_GLOUD
STVNRKGAKECIRCHVPFFTAVTSAAPSQIFCPQCGFLNDGGNLKCVQCDITIRSTLEKLGTDLRDSTNFLARDMGVNINVKCPGCMTVCFVPPATACLRCGTCHTYFASPTVGEVTNFHMSRLAMSISSSFMGLFNQKRETKEEQEAKETPVGKLIALGDKTPRSPLRAGRTRNGSASFRSSGSQGRLSVDENESKQAESVSEFARQEEAFEKMHTASYPMAVPSSSPSPLSSSVALARTAPQDLVKVEGEIVEL